MKPDLGDGPLHERELVRIYARETRPNEVAAQHLATRALAHHAASSRRLPWAAPLGLATALVLAGLLGMFFLGPTPTPVALSSPEATASANWSDGIALEYQGNGELSGTALRWESGRVEVEVPPDRGLSFTVHTREAEVRVVGTGFSVYRSALGTDVVVTHGEVAVTCEGAETRAIHPGERLNCPPTSAPGLLARSRLLRAQKAPTEEVLAAIDLGLGRVQRGDPVEAELRYLRAETTYRAGRNEEATADLEAWRVLGDPIREVDALRLAAGLAVEAGDCAAALPSLERLVAAEPEAADLILYAGCLGPHRVGEAKAALLRAIEHDPNAETATVAHTRLADLGGE